MRYRDAEGRTYVEPQRLDFGHYWGTTRASVKGDEAKELEKIRKALERWTASATGGLMVESPEQHREEVERVRADLAERRRQRDEDIPPDGPPSDG